MILTGETEVLGENPVILSLCTPVLHDKKPTIFCLTHCTADSEDEDSIQSILHMKIQR